MKRTVKPLDSSASPGGMFVTGHLGDQGCGLHRAKLPERASVVSECYYIRCPADTVS